MHLTGILRRMQTNFTKLVEHEFGHFALLSDAVIASRAGPCERLACRLSLIHAQLQMLSKLSISAKGSLIAI